MIPFSRRDDFGEERKLVARRKTWAKYYGVAEVS